MSWVRRKRCDRARGVAGGLGALGERVSIQAHLAHCELRLRLATADGQTARLRALDALHDYWRAGQFPRNVSNSGRRPVFIDDSGTHCALGYLMASTGEAALAVEFDRCDRFAYIEDLPSPLPPQLQSWLDEHQLSRGEAALIQPSYGPCGQLGVYDCVGFVHTGLSALDAAVAAVSLAAGAALLAAVALLGWMAKGTWRDKALRSLQAAACFTAAVAAVVVLVLAADAVSPASGVETVWRFSVWSAQALAVSAAGLWLLRWRQQRPMAGFDERRARYRLTARAGFAAITVVLLLDAAAGALISGPSGDQSAHVSVPVLLMLPWLWAHRPLRRLQPALRRWVVATCTACAISVTLIVPPPTLALSAVTHNEGDTVTCEWRLEPVCRQNYNTQLGWRAVQLSVWQPR